MHITKIIRQWLAEAATCGRLSVGEKVTIEILQKKQGVIACALFVLLFTVYQLNGDFQISNDTTASVFLPVSLLNEGNLSFTPEEFPFLFDKNDGRYDPKYFLVKTIHPGVYVSSFGMGAGITALPVFAVLKFVFQDLFATHLWYGAKVVASLSVAGSAVFIFFSAAYFLCLRYAFLIAVVYGLGTCVWSVSSQALWQHGPSELFLSLGAWALIRSHYGCSRSIFLAGSALGFAVLCRPTNALVVIVVAAWLLVNDRKVLMKFLLGGAPFAIWLLLYNIYYFGTPLFFGQIEVSREFTSEKLNVACLWCMPLWEGLKGLLFSPSRGLLIFSPVMLFSFPSFLIVFKNSRYRAFIPVALSAAGIVLLASKWYDWWGGWTFGYRPIVDAMPLLALLLVPVMERILKKSWITVVFAVVLIWSVGVQVLGAYAYSLEGWQNRAFYDVVFKDNSRLRFSIHPSDSDEKIMLFAQQHQAASVVLQSGNIDAPENRYRLWSIGDGQLVYSLMNFKDARFEKKQEIENWINSYDNLVKQKLDHKINDL